LKVYFPKRSYEFYYKSYLVHSLLSRIKIV